MDIISLYEDSSHNQNEKALAALNPQILFSMNSSKSCYGGDESTITAEQQQESSLVCRSGGRGMRRMSCKSRTSPKDHTIETAYFEISDNAPHGMILVCSHFGCAMSGSRFRYCSVCDIPVAKRNFPARHSHGMWPPKGGEYTNIEQEQDEEDEEHDNDDDMSQNSHPKKKLILDDLGSTTPKRQRQQLPTLVPPLFLPKTAPDKNMELCRPVSSHSAANNNATPQQYPLPLFSAPLSSVPMDPRPQLQPYTSLPSTSSQHGHQTFRATHATAYHQCNSSSSTTRRDNNINVNHPPKALVELDARELAWLRLLHSRPKLKRASPPLHCDNRESGVGHPIKGMDKWLESVLHVSSLPSSYESEACVLPLTSPM